MILIAHRGNYAGRVAHLENTMVHLRDAISRGYDVEVDLWVIDGLLYLGHDGPEHLASPSEIKELEPRAWFHAKNHAALVYGLQNSLHVFFHDRDEYTLTSRGIIWAYSGKLVEAHGIAVMPEYTPDYVVSWDALGVCSDDLVSYSESI